MKDSFVYCYALEKICSYDYILFKFWGGKNNQGVGPLGLPKKK